MSIIDDLNKKQIWEEFLEYKLNKNLLSPKEQSYIKEYIKKESYLKICNEIIKGEYEFSPPTKHLINKIDNSKKRVVYTFNDDETMVLKLISYLLYKYDDKLSPNCYSFRKNLGVKQAIRQLVKHNTINQLYCYKVDIKNYFNSIDIELLLPKLKQVINGDDRLYIFLANLLKSNKAIFCGQEVLENKGIMAGVPISSFLANVFLKDIDEYYYKNNIIYARYSDDIIFFCEKEQLDYRVKELENNINQHNLELNENKRVITKPGGKISFLGFSYQNGVIDLSDITKNKIKGKIRRAARKIRRWMLKKQANPERAIKVMTKKFNNKFYGFQTGKQLTWIRWFFPVINTTQGLKEIDYYMQQYLRYIVTGKHNKKNYEKVGYDLLKRCNYKSLVNQYYCLKKTNKIILMAKCKC